VFDFWGSSAANSSLKTAACRPPFFFRQDQKNGSKTAVTGMGRAGDRRL